jgi:micrococcal nuclease
MRRRRRRTLLALVATVVVLVVATRSANRSDSDIAGSRGGGTVVSITDGDTLRIRIVGIEERVRLIGIDTPETRGRGGLRECFGAEATEHMKRLLPPGTAVRLERDVEARDRYDRLLAYVYRAEDDLFVNMALARDGYAAALTFPPNVTYAEQFRDAAAEARDAGRGLWSACGGPDTRIEG